MRFESAILGVSEFICVANGLLKEHFISGYCWIITVDLSAMANTVFMEYIILFKCLKAFLIHLCHFVYLSE